MDKSDVICENLLYGGTKSVLLDQLFQQFVIIFMLETVQGATKMFAVDFHS